MNTCLLKSGALFIYGLLRVGLGHLLVSSQLRASGYQMMTNARCQFAIGDAQKIIRLCIKRQQSKLTALTSQSSQSSIPRS
ncbi:hypothetical protein [Undibacterium umbellatum]|uniref:Secreted protein n=1 Tax=Undibacterium umbellatum TaxID=2762300 RepID=A0ABR6Z5U1_9BURK|nr:hypothetical protein [Undibacterium umbellatum]MBC3907144.1 hypothetical protein [Undibacterium umbellatum]